MRVIIFDVGDANCALIIDNQGRSLMIDCGLCSDKDCPIEAIRQMKEPGQRLSHMGPTLDSLHISHPDKDHICNIKTLMANFPPTTLGRRPIPSFCPSDIVECDDPTYQFYKESVCGIYNGPHLDIPYEFEICTHEIPMEVVATLPESKINNSSRITIIKYMGYKIAFCGDMEKAGWEWILEKATEEIIHGQDGPYNKFVNDMHGVDILVAPHHGHYSGYSENLMSFMGNPALTILSKGSEEGGETDVTSSYSQRSVGKNVEQLADSIFEVKKTVTTRSNGNIFLNFFGEKQGVGTEEGTQDGRHCYVSKGLQRP